MQLTCCSIVVQHLLQASVGGAHACAIGFSTSRCCAGNYGGGPIQHGMACCRSATALPVLMPMLVPSVAALADIVLATVVVARAR